MNYNFYVHGVPYGQDIWGDGNDREVVKSYYNGDQNEQVRFVIDILPSKGKVFYSYLIAHNVFDNGSRPGSYFAMTLAVEGHFCKDTSNLYDLFDQVFNKYCNKILTSQSSSFKYKIRSFADISKDLEEMEAIVYKTLANSFSNDFELINLTQIKGNNGSIQYNIKDVDSPTFFDSFRRYLKVIITLDYPTRDQIIDNINKQINPLKEQNKQLSSELSKLHSICSDTKAKLTDLEKRNGNLTEEKQNIERELNKKSKELETSQSDVRKLKSELTNKRAAAQVADSVSKIREPLNELLSLLRTMEPENNSPSYSRYSNDPLGGNNHAVLEGGGKRKHRGHTKHRKQLNKRNVWLLLLALLLLLGLGLLLFKVLPHNRTVKSTQESELVQLQSELHKCKEENIRLSDELKLLRESFTIEYKEIPNSKNEYTASIGIGNLEWKADGVKIQGDKKTQETKIIVEKEPAVLSCYIGKTKVDSRPFEITK